MMLVSSATFDSFTYAASGPVVLGFGDERAMGVVYAANGPGSAGAAFVVGATGVPRRRMRGMLVGIGVVGLGVAVIAWQPSVLLVSIGCILLGSAQSLVIALQRAIYQLHALPEVVGRVLALRLMVVTGANAAGLLTAGWLAASVFEPAMARGLASGSRRRRRVAWMTINIS